MKKKILVALIGLVLIMGSIWFIPHCGGDGGYLLFTIPLGLVAIFGQKYLDLN